MAKQTWCALVAAAVLVSGTSTRAQIAVLPLVDAEDPIKLSDTAFDATDPERPAITVRLENTTAGPLPTNWIWLSVIRFYTPDETRQNGNGVIWSCGLMARANHSEPTQIIQPGAGVPIRFEMKAAACTLDPRHEHFSIGVSRITTGKRLADTIWKREPADQARLLHGAMLVPH